MLEVDFETLIVDAESGVDEYLVFKDTISGQSEVVCECVCVVCVCVPVCMWDMAKTYKCHCRHCENLPPIFPLSLFKIVSEQPKFGINANPCPCTAHVC